MQRDLAELETRTQASIDEVMAAQNDADRAAAKTKLEALRRDQADMERRLAEARAAAGRAARKKGAPVSQECMDNPLAKGCM
jgi:hypothetical protein